MSSNKPAWRRVFDDVERKIGQPLEDAANSSTFVDVALQGMRVQRAVGGALGRVAGGAVSTLLRAVDVPTRTDISKLSRQVTVLTSEVRQLKAGQQAQERVPQARATAKEDDGS